MYIYIYLSLSLYIYIFKGMKLPKVKGPPENQSLEDLLRENL